MNLSSQALVAKLATVVGASVPSFASWLLAAACYVVAAVQGIGFIGVFKVRVIRAFREITMLTISYLYRRKQVSSRNT